MVNNKSKHHQERENKHTIVLVIAVHMYIYIIYIGGDFFMYLVSRIVLGKRLYLCVQWVDGRMKFQNTPITFFEKLDIFAEDYCI